MNKVICPFCHQEVTEESEPEEVKTYTGKYICFKKICRNIARHYGNGNIVIPYKKFSE